MKKINTDGQLTVKEFLQLEDWYYNLENPIEYAIEGAKGAEVLSAHCSPDSVVSVKQFNFAGQTSDNVEALTIAQEYRIRLSFASGLVIEEVHACQETFDNKGVWFLLDNGEDNMAIYPTGKISGTFYKIDSDEEEKQKYTNFTLSISELDGEGESGEIYDVINVHTDTKVLSGLMKIITTSADDVSYYIDDVWQDGDVLKVSAKDSASGSGGGGGGSYSFVKILDNYNGTFPAGKVTCAYGEPTKISVAMAAMKDIVDGGGKILGFTLDASSPAIFLSNVCVRKGGSDEYISFIAHQDDANIYDVSTYGTILFFMFNAPGPASESDVNFTASVYAICAD